MVRGLNKTTIDWCTYSWNVITGCDNRMDCYKYCYARSIHKRFLKTHPHYNKDFKYRFNTDILFAPTRLNSPSIIFIGSMGEWWHPFVSITDQVFILDVVNNCPQHQFVCLTKQIGNMKGIVNNWIWHEEFENEKPRWRHEKGCVLPWNLWVGTTVSTKADVERLLTLEDLKHNAKFVSFEPLLEDVAAEHEFFLETVEWVIIGGLRRGGSFVNPDPGHLLKLIAAARQADCRVFIKDNCTVLTNPPREYPEVML